jgi:hypothetical protein
MKLKLPQQISIALAMLAPDMLQAHVDSFTGAYRHDAEAPLPQHGRMAITIDPTGIDRFTRSVRVIASTPNPVKGQAAITSWDLTRFLKNPVVLWAHDTRGIPIGVASEIDPNDPAGLSMRLRFASSKVSEMAEQVWNGILEEVVKAVSVGYDPIGDGSASLSEVSVVPVGLDEDAGTPALNDAAAREPTDEQRAAMVKSAAATLARHLHHVRTKRRLLIANAVEATGEGRALGNDPPTVEDDRTDADPGKAAEKASNKAGSESKKAGQHDTPGSHFFAAQAHHKAASAWKKLVGSHPHAATNVALHEKLAEHHGSAFKALSDNQGHAGGTGKSSSAGGGNQSRDENGRFDLKEDEVLRMDVAPLRLDGLRNTPSGGKEIKARLTRVGVLKYRDTTMPDGWRRELRLPEDVFNADSLATLKGATLIDIKDHTGMVTPDTWSRSALGTIMDVRRDGDYVDSIVHVNAREALTALERGDRQDVSCGYKCRLEWKAGEWRGEKYDCIQRGHVYNHVALCPPNGGRAGTDVGVRVDNATASNLPQWGVSHWDSEEITTMDKIIIRFDGRDLEYGSKDHLDALDRHHKSELESLTAAHAKTADQLKADFKVNLDAAEAERDGSKQQLEIFKADLKEKDKAAEEKKAKDEEEYKRTRGARRQLERHAFRLLSRVKPDDEDKDEEDEEDEDDKKKPAFLKEKGKRAKPSTAKLDSFLDEATDRQIHERVIKALPGGEKFDSKDLTDLHVKVRYDMVMESVGQTLGNGITDVVRTIKESQERVDNLDSDDSPLSVMQQARRARDKSAAEAGRAPAFNGGAAK